MQKRNSGIFLESAHFPIWRKMISFNKVFGKIGIFRVLCQQFGYFGALKSNSGYCEGFSKKFSQAYLSPLH